MVKGLGKVNWPMGKAELGSINMAPQSTRVEAFILSLTCGEYLEPMVYPSRAWPWMPPWQAHGPPQFSNLSSSLLRLMGRSPNLFKCFKMQMTG